MCWDPQQSGGANLGGSGTWTNGGAAVWYNPATKTDVVWNDANGDTAVFQGKTGTVTVGSGVSAGSIGFEAQGYALSGGTISLTQNSTPGWTTGEVRVDGSADRIDAVLGGSVDLTKTGPGTLTLTGANTYGGVSGGVTAIQNGTLVVAGGDNRLPSGTTVTLGDAANQTSGILQLGNAATASNQTLAALTNDMDYQYDATGNRVVGGGSHVATLTLNVAAGADYEFDGILGGGGSDQNNVALTMTGPGTEELGGVNSYGGGTTLRAGVLQVWNGAALGSGAVTSAGGALRNLASTSYYVDPAGLGGTPSDTNPGTIHNPLATLAEAYRLCKPDDTIILRGGTYHLADLGYGNSTSGAPGAPLTIEAAPGEHPIIDLAEWETWQPDGNGCWYTNLPATSYMLSSPEVEIRNGAAATEIDGDSVNGGPPTAFTQPDSAYYQNGQLAFDLTWYDAATRATTCSRKVERLLLRGMQSNNRDVQGTCRELYEHRRWLWTFLHHEGVEPANNAGERWLRHAVIWRKLSFGTQSAAGSRFVETMLTVIETCRQQRRNAFAFITAAVEAHLAHQSVPSLLPRV